MNAFMNQDAVGRAKTVCLFPQHQLVQSLDQYAVWDLSGITTNIAGEEKPFLIEVKDRNLSSYDYDTVYLEYKKYKSLIEVARVNNIEDIFYINHYPALPHFAGKASSSSAFAQSAPDRCVYNVPLKNRFFAQGQHNPLNRHYRR